jgi:hypothetical protein
MVQDDMTLAMKKKAMITRLVTSVGAKAGIYRLLLT